MGLNIYMSDDAWGYLCHGMYFKRVEQVHGQRNQMQFIRNEMGGGIEVLSSSWQAWALKRVQLLFQKQPKVFTLVKSVYMRWGWKSNAFLSFTEFCQHAFVQVCSWSQLSLFV